MNTPSLHPSILGVVLAFLSCAVQAQEQPPAQDAVAIPGAPARIVLPSGFSILAQTEAFKFLAPFYHPNPDVDALLLPPNTGAPWYIKFKFYRSGYASLDQLQDDVEGLDLFQELRKKTREENRQREREGYFTVNVTRSIERPTLDTERPMVDFAVETLQSTDFSVERHILLPSRSGILHCTVVCLQGTYPAVKQLSNEIIAALTFNAGERYEDFDPESDAEASGGIGLAIFGIEPQGPNWFAIFVVVLFALVVAYSFFEDKLFPKKKKRAVAKKPGTRPVSRKPSVKR
ncbi:MAG: DUF2167 domain-containing protein [Bacteroidota bacterium]